MVKIYTLQVRLPHLVGVVEVQYALAAAISACCARCLPQIFDRQGQPLFYREWDRPVPQQKDEHKLTFGFLFSLKQLVGKMSPKK